MEPILAQMEPEYEAGAETTYVPETNEPDSNTDSRDYQSDDEQGLTREENYCENHIDWKMTGKEPFQVQSGYSALLTNMQFMQRYEPYTSAFISQYGGQETAERAPYDFASVYGDVLTSASNTELVPEFFFIPELFQNRNMIHNGLANATEKDQQDFTEKKKVIGDQLKLPPYAVNTHDLVRIFREELESDYVKQNIYKWIDLIYGVDQKDASKYNRFVSAAYPDFHKKDVLEFDDTTDDKEEKYQTAFCLVKNVDETGIIPPRLFDVTLRPKDVHDANLQATGATDGAGGNANPATGSSKGRQTTM